MAIKHLKDGESFEFSKDFGFHGSANGTGKGDHHSGKNSSFKSFAEGGEFQGPDEPDTTDSGHSVEESNRYAKGGMHHMHPHGHKVVRSEHHHDGSVTMHHAHGGMTVHHAHGGISHHNEEGAEIASHEGGFDSEPGTHMAHGGMHMAKGSAVHAHPHGHHVVHVEERGDAEVHHHAHGGMTVHHGDGRVSHHAKGGMEVGHGGGGDMAQDKALIKKAFNQHDDDLHGGKHEDLRLARGGAPHIQNQRLPRGMKPKMARHQSPIGASDPTRNPTPRNAMPSGTMGYGVQPSDEPSNPMADTDNSDSDIGTVGMRRGGAHRF